MNLILVSIKNIRIFLKIHLSKNLFFFKKKKKGSLRIATTGGAKKGVN